MRYLHQHLSSLTLKSAPQKLLWISQSFAQRFYNWKLSVANPATQRCSVRGIGRELFKTMEKIFNCAKVIMIPLLIQKTINSCVQHFYPPEGFTVSKVEQRAVLCLGEMLVLLPP